MRCGTVCLPPATTCGCVRRVRPAPTPDCTDCTPPAALPAAAALQRCTVLPRRPAAARRQRRLRNARLSPDRTAFRCHCLPSLVTTSYRPSSPLPIVPRHHLLPSLVTTAFRPSSPLPSVPRHYCLPSLVTTDYRLSSPPLTILCHHCLPCVFTTAYRPSSRGRQNSSKGILNENSKWFVFLLFKYKMK